jgi:hypothetical protein
MKSKKTDNAATRSQQRMGRRRERAPLVEIAPNQGLRKYDWHVPIVDILRGIKLWKKNRAKSAESPTHRICED